MAVCGKGIFVMILIGSLFPDMGMPLPLVQVMMCPKQCNCQQSTVEECTVTNEEDLQSIRNMTVSELKTSTCILDILTENTNIKATKVTLNCKRSMSISDLRKLNRLFPSALTVVNNWHMPACEYKLFPNTPECICNPSFTRLESSISACYCIEANSGFSKECSASIETEQGTSSEITSNMDTIRVKRGVSNNQTGILSSGFTSLSPIKLQSTLTPKSMRTLEAKAQSNASKTAQSSTSLGEEYGNNCSQVNNGTLCNSTAPNGGTFKYRYLSVYAIWGVSGLALFINFFVIVHLCSCGGATNAIVVMGEAMAIFNIMLACYGIGMASNMYWHDTEWKKYFCQGLNSIKLFAIGSSVWTLLLMTFQNSIRTSSPDERDAVFKTIVYILEGIMLSGVMCVMSWIKLDKWNYLCTIITPTTTVEKMLVGIELFHYVILMLLVIRFPYYLYKRSRAVEKPPPRTVDKEHPIFIIIFLSCLIWATVYIYTYKFLILSFEFTAVVRLVVLMVPIIFQPLAFASRNTCLCCTGPMVCCGENSKKPIEDGLLACNCEGDESCRVCEANMEMKEILSDTAENVDETAKSEEKKVTINEDKTIIPVLVCRSPVSETKEDEKVDCDVTISVNPPTPNPIERKDNENEMNNVSAPTAVQDDDDTTECLPLTQKDKNFDQSTTVDGEGRVSRGPTFIPIEPKSKEVKEKKKRIRLLKSKSKKNQDSDDDDIDEEANETDRLVDSNKLNGVEEVKSKDKPRKRRPRKKDGQSGQLIRDVETPEKKKTASMDSLEWDPSYSYSDSSAGSAVDELAPLPTNTPSHYGKTNSNKSSPTGTKTSTNCMEWDPTSVQVRSGSTDCEWEPYGVDEPGSGSTSGRASTISEKAKTLQKGSSSEEAQSPTPIK